MICIQEIKSLGIRINKWSSKCILFLKIYPQHDDKEIKWSDFSEKSKFVFYQEGRYKKFRQNSR